MECIRFTIDHGIKIIILLLCSCGIESEFLGELELVATSTRLVLLMGSVPSSLHSITNGLREMFKQETGQVDGI